MREFLIYQAVMGMVGITLSGIIAAIAEKNSSMAAVSSYCFALSIFLIISATITYVIIGF